MTAPMHAAQLAADAIRDRRAAEGTLGKPQPVPAGWCSCEPVAPVGKGAAR